MKDRYGFTFAERLDTQAQQLELWKTLLRPEVYDSLVGVLAVLNTEARSSEQRHGVPLGGELQNLIAAYPRHMEITEKALMGEIVTSF